MKRRKPFLRTISGNRDRLITHYGDVLRWIEPRGWHVRKRIDDESFGPWRPDRLAAERMSADLHVHIKREADAAADEGRHREAEAPRDWALQSQVYENALAVLRLARRHLEREANYVEGD